MARINESNRLLETNSNENNRRAKNVQEETLEYYKLNSERFKSELINEKKIEELKSELFAKKFYFQVNFNQSDNRFWLFNVFTFVTDFYLSQTYIDSLEQLYVQLIVVLINI